MAKKSKEKKPYTLKTFIFDAFMTTCTCTLWMWYRLFKILVSK